MTNRINFAWMLSILLTVAVATVTMAQQAPTGGVVPARPQGPCDIYASAGDACVMRRSSSCRSELGTQSGDQVDCDGQHDRAEEI